MVLLVSIFHDSPKYSSRLHIPLIIIGVKVSVYNSESVSLVVQVPLRRPVVVPVLTWVSTTVSDTRLVS